jgi:23S rRNA (cytosine1962-C5)-methyltransferase
VERNAEATKNGDRPSVVLKKGRESSILRRHPWVFSGAIFERRGSATNGTLVDVFAHDGRFVGAGHWGTSSIAVRLLSFERVESETELLGRRIQESLVLRRSLGLLENPRTDAFRLMHGEGDMVPGLVVDLYGSTAVVQSHSAGMWRLRAAIAASLQELSEGRIARVLQRRVESVHASAEEVESETAGAEGEPDIQEGTGSSPDGLVTIQENGFRFVVDVEKGQKTGFFLDQRENREYLKGIVRGKRVLNAFCYSGAFSVYALGGGAEWVCSVDASKAAVELCRQNVALNFPGPTHTAEVADCFHYLQTIHGAYDLIVLDPPAFAKHRRAVERGLKGYEAINAMALRSVRPGGAVLTFSCSQLISRDDFRDVLLRAAAQAGRRVQIVHQFHQAPCHPIHLAHPEGDYLKGFALVVA